MITPEESLYIYKIVNSLVIKEFEEDRRLVYAWNMSAHFQYIQYLINISFLQI